ILAWEHLLQFSFIPMVAAAALTWVVLRGMRGQRGVATVGAYISAAAKLFRNKTLIAVVLLSGTRSLSHHTVIIFIHIYLREDLDYSTFVVGVYVSLLHLVGVVTHPILGSLSDRFGRKAVLTPGMISFGLLCLALAFAAPGVQLTLTILASGAFIFTFHAIFVAAAMDLAAEEVHGTTVALMYTSSFVVGAIGPLLGGLLADAYGVKATFIFAGSVVIATALLLWAVRLPKVGSVAATESN
ncbi:MAG: MFS transporter, partial [Dehalococcoidia bacterium]